MHKKQKSIRYTFEIVQQRVSSSSGIASEVDFSPDLTHRYWLERTWNANRSKVAFCMLNPSTADALKNDPTVERCERRARTMGFGGFIIINIFSLRATNPKQLYKNIQGDWPEVSSYIKKACREAEIVICGWGKHGNYQERGTRVLEELEFLGVKPHCLGKNKDGTPKHPLYISYRIKPKALSLA